ncbi:MAG: hypothetical protein LQ348_007287 [Seirophora lacunosa]|nr:MAG: hypothetical protein LQ348_007287 [Seirophora lacunosa]
MQASSLDSWTRPSSTKPEAAPAPVPHQLPDRTLQPNACVICQRRKVKCDRTDPCLNCVKHRVQCEYRAPAPPRRRKRQSPDPQLHAKVRRYEQILQQHGVRVDDLDRSRRPDKSFERASSLAGATSDSGIETKYGPETSKSNSSNGHRKPKPPENAPYAATSEEFKHLEELLESSDHEGNRKPGPGLIQQAYDKLHADGSGLLFGFSVNHDLKRMHPGPINIFRLWQTYLDCVYPLSMIFHAPTVQQQILDASADLENISESTEALMFAIYHAAVVALPQEDCEAMFSLPQPVVMNKYMLATQQALNAAKLLKNHDITVLQALVIFLVGRLAHIKRRLWWQIVVLDTRVAELSGAGTSILTALFDTHLPSNVNDSNLKPEMGEISPDHPGTSDMTFCLARYEIISFLKHSNTTSFFLEGAWAKPDTVLATLAEKDHAIDELEQRLEEKYLRHCDPQITLHFLTKMFSRTAVYRMRLIAHHPRHYPDKGASMPTEEKDLLCRLSLNMIENDNITQRNKPADKFSWFINTNLQFPALIYLISELRHRTGGELADRGWQAISESFQYRMSFIAERKQLTMFQAIAALTLKAWQARETGARAHNEPMPEPPDCILTLRRTFGEPPPPPSGLKEGSVAGGPEHPHTPADAATAHGHPGEGRPDLVPGAANNETAPEPGTNPTEWSPIDWTYWDELIQNWEPQIPDGSEQFDFGQPFNIGAAAAR